MIIPDISLEQTFWDKGIINIAGVDEAGKGPLAGPVTAGAVMIHKTDQIVSAVRDSKLMSATQREKVFDVICTFSSSFGIGIVGADEIDAIGIDLAVKKAMLIALASLEQKLKKPISYVIVDGSRTKPLEQYPSQRILKGGLYHYSIAAGSVLAKVTHDRIMKKLAIDYPQYGFDKHVGYGTQAHIQALEEYGPCLLHRKSFAPISSITAKKRTTDRSIILED